MKSFSHILLRISMSLVFLWFGFQQLASPTDWIGFLPTWTVSLPISQIGFVYLNGWFEVVAGLFLLAGFYTRAAALLLGLHLLGIAYTIGYGAIAVRDVGLALATLSVFLYGRDKWSLDKKF
ncbi:MAG: DoxX family membrane protein [Candidatus Pacebacteria bacterium]|nr:DoxX family membrane protein [Candidatus Paceibacterota bacterium]